ncbi:MAG: hypothetical protein AABY64_06470 [Bdellovibrionota bacterium]
MSHFLIKPRVVEAWNCQVRFEFFAYEEYIRQIENDFKNDIYFWAWINHEGFQTPISARLSPVPSCSEFSKEKPPGWLTSEHWRYLYTQEYRDLRQSLTDIDKMNKTVHARIKDFQDRRTEWWEPISVDLKKICSLVKQVKRLMEIKLHLQSICQATDKPDSPSRCRKEIKNVEKLIQREETPLNENREKMKLKWPYLGAVIESQNSCD